MTNKEVHQSVFKMMEYPAEHGNSGDKKREHGLSNTRRELLEDTLRRHKVAFDILSKH
jgi:hypothetical protein